VSKNMANPPTFPLSNRVQLTFSYSSENFLVGTVTLSSHLIFSILFYIDSNIQVFLWGLSGPGLTRSNPWKNRLRLKKSRMSVT